MYRAVAPMLLVQNVDQALAWYRDVLGADLQYSSPQNPPFQWVSLRLDDIEIMLVQKEAAQGWYSDQVTISEMPANFIAYVYVKQLDTLYGQIKGKAPIVKEPTEQPYGVREFAIRHPFGFILVFAQILE